MKKLICAAVVAGSMFAMAEEAPKAKAPAVPAAAEAVKAMPQRRQMTPEQRQKMREQREKFMAERKAKMEAQTLEIVKKYVSDEEKAKALVKELQDVVMAGRRNAVRRPRPEAAKPAEDK